MNMAQDALVSFVGRVLSAGGALCFLVGSVVHCGGRNLSAAPGDDDATQLSSAHSGGAGGEGEGGGTGGAGGDAGEGGEGGAPTGGFNPLDCFGCIAQNCPAALECIQDPLCRDGMVCAVTDCLGGGSPDIACFGTCFGGDFQAGLKAYQAITCVLGDCGEFCQGGAGGLPF